MLYASRFIRLHYPFMKGPDVLEIQNRLAEKEFNPGSADGIFGPNSASALEEFQAAMKLTENGIVGPDTWRALQPLKAYLRSQPSEPAEQADKPRIHVHVDTRILTITSNGTIKAYPVAVGRRSTPTPVGEWKIVFKSVNPGGPFGVRWMRLSVPWGGYGIHGTNNPKSIGKAVSHGCVRLYNEDVIKLYDQVPIGTPVSITGTVRKIRQLKVGRRGNDVRDVQHMLLELGYTSRKPTGYYGQTTRRAVIAFQRQKKLKRDGVVGIITYKALQIAHDLFTDNTDP